MEKQTSRFVTAAVANRRRNIALLVHKFESKSRTANQHFVNSICDGDGPIWRAEGPPVRLLGIAAQEMGGSCNVGHPCPDADPHKARDDLVRLIGKSDGVTREGHTHM